MHQHPSDDFGTDTYSFSPDGSYFLTRTVRTYRPMSDEMGQAFRRRVAQVADRFRPHGTVEVVEEIRAGALVQSSVTVTYTPPQPVGALDDCTAGGRPATPRGQRGGSHRSAA